MGDIGYMTLTDPFSTLSEYAQRVVFNQRHQQVVAQKRLNKLIENYKELLDDSRYGLIKEDLRAQLGSLLMGLVEHACKCSHCAPKAHEIRLLHQVIGEPIEAVWYDAHREQPEASEEDNGFAR